MGHMGNSGRIAIGAFLAALALLALTGITLHGTVFLWFLAASAAAYVACVSEVVIRRRHRTLVASGIGSILFIAFSIAFLRQWGLAFNADPDALSTRVDADHPDLYFYFAAASGAATLLLLVAGTVLPGRGRRPRAGTAPRRRPAAARGAAPRAAAARRAPSRTATARPAPRTAAGRATSQSARVPPPRAASSGLKRPASSAGGPSAAKPAAKPPAKSPARPAARSSTRR
ncbi:hypothetical protein J2X01_003018 [Arthrobacter ginsengisoli]|uniref:Uncharacterized protein n=1 Tax=Arthrobacter ginsengisoli TaxID=1356565 RepID=A0ABU1UEZ4_9MICC|nr:hypothetical protein [Arthrobacter ginsengisoli]